MKQVIIFSEAFKKDIEQFFFEMSQIYDNIEHDEFKINVSLFMQYITDNVKDLTVGYSNFIVQALEGEGYEIRYAVKYKDERVIFAVNGEEKIKLKTFGVYAIEKALEWTKTQSFLMT